MKTIIHHEYETRFDIVNFIKNQNGNAIELGVASGIFTEKLLERTDMFVFGIDMWADRRHDVNEYKNAFKRCKPYISRFSLLKMKFHESLDLFDDNFFDFIYVDGYAHTGEDNGKTFYDWYPKLKDGGIFAGDDYHKDWPLVIEQVDKFVKKFNKDLHILPNTDKGKDMKENWSSKYPSWFIIK